jgi:hypothetical protein
MKNLERTMLIIHLCYIKRRMLYKTNFDFEWGK